MKEPIERQQRSGQPVTRRCAGCSAVITGRPNKRYCSKLCADRAAQRRRRNPDRASGDSAPVPSVIRGSNGVLIATVARLGYVGGPSSKVLDTTYGRGMFWTRYRPPGLVIGKDDFRAMRFGDGSFDIVVFDPPYISTGSRDTSSIDDFYDRFGLGDLKGWRATRQLIDDGLADCARVVSPRRGCFLLVKCMDYVESGTKRWNTFHVAAEAERLGLRLVDRFHHVTGGGAQPLDNLDGSPRRQGYAREVSSMLLVFRKRA